MSSVSSILEISRIRRMRRWTDASAPYLALLGLSAVGTLSQGSPLKGLAMGALGLLAGAALARGRRAPVIREESTRAQSTTEGTGVHSVTQTNGVTRKCAGRN